MIKARITGYSTPGPTDLEQYFKKTDEKRLNLTLRVDSETDLQEELFNSENKDHKIFIYRPEDIPAPGAFIKDVYVNAAKKTVAVKFKDGKIVKKTACESDTFDVYAGVALCLATYMSASSKNFHSFVDRRVRNSAKPKAED